MEEKDTSHSNYIWLTLRWTLFLGFLLTLMIYCSLNKSVTITSVAAPMGDLTAAEEAPPQVINLAIRATSKEHGISIPLADGILAENVVVENHAAEHELLVCIVGADASMYEGESISGDVNHLMKATVSVQEDSLLFAFQMDRIFEYSTVLQPGRLVISYRNPSDVYRTIVVVGAENSEVAKLLPEMLMDDNIGVYAADSEERALDLYNELGADLVVLVGTSESEDKTEYGIAASVNNLYFIPNFGNMELASLLTERVTVAVSNKACDIAVAQPDSILWSIKVPAARINVGFLSNEKEGLLLQNKSYQMKLAEGIAEAIREAVQRMAAG